MAALNDEESRVMKSLYPYEDTGECRDVVMQFKEDIREAKVNPSGCSGSSSSSSSNGNSSNVAAAAAASASTAAAVVVVVASTAVVVIVVVTDNYPFLHASQ